MKKAIVIMAALAASFAGQLPAQADRAMIGGQMAPPNVCHSDWIKSLGNPPCEIMGEPTVVRCDLDRPYYMKAYRFRWFNGTEWSQWWLYYRWYKPAPQKVCRP